MHRSRSDRRSRTALLRFRHKRPFTPEDLERIELRMAELAKRDLPVVREVWRATRPWNSSSRSASNTRPNHRIDSI